MSSQNNEHDIHNLLFRLLENDLTDAQRDYLLEWSRTDREAVAVYHDFLQAYSIISHEISSSVKPDSGASADTQFDQALWQSLLNDAKTAPEIEVERTLPENELIRKVVYPPRERRRISRVGMAFIAANVAAILCIVLFIKFAPPRGGHVVATLTDSLNARWADMDGGMVKGTPIVSGGKSLLLREGFAEILFSNHSRVTIEGPSEFEIPADDQIRLLYGRLYASVPREAIGFTVKTPSSQIVDLGTEFGVHTDFQGDTSLHVVKGKTVLIAGDRSNKVSVEVNGGAAKKVTAATQTVSEIACDERFFVRDIDSGGNFIWRGERAISVADIVAGGNGFGKVQRLSGIDPGTGQITPSVSTRIRRSEKDYNLVNDSTFIDGVFVPDGGGVVTSSGLTVQGPDTKGEYTHGIAVYTGDVTKQHDKIPAATFDGHTYENAAIVMIHSNSGITFDLKAIRQSLGGLHVTRFTAFGGISESIIPKFRSPDVDFRVLVDGQVRYEKPSITLEDNEVTFDIDLGPDDRFLTLIVTDGTRAGEPRKDYAAWNNDFFYLVDPKLEIAPRSN